MTEESVTQSKLASHPVVQQISWITGIFGFIVSLTTAIGAATSTFNMALLAIFSGLAMFLIFVSLTSSYWSSRKQNLKTLLYEIRKQSSKMTTPDLPGTTSQPSYVRERKKKTVKHLSLLRLAYRLALFEGRKDIADDISEEMEQIGNEY